MEVTIQIVQILAWFRASTVAIEVAYIHKGESHKSGGGFLISVSCM